MEINLEERDKIQSFLNQFLFVEGAVYTLFGDKPITQMLIFIGTDADLPVLSEEELKTAIPREDLSPETGPVWKHFVSKIPSKHFLFAERPCLRNPHFVLYSLLNIDRVKEVLSKHKLAFQKKTACSFDIDKVIQEFSDPHSSFWNQVFLDHYLSGLLYGFGEENIVHFLNRMEDQEIEARFSDENDDEATPSKFPIPIFAMSAQDKTSARYQEQRKIIQEIYRGKDIVDVTLRRFAD
jgi:hypothetical protein